MVERTRLRREIDSYFPLNGGEVPADNSSKLSEMPFLNAVMYAFAMFFTTSL